MVVTMTRLSISPWFLVRVDSIDLAWDALMGIQYTELRQAIYQTTEEFQRFRQLLVNAVLATDIM